MLFTHSMFQTDVAVKWPMPDRYIWAESPNMELGEENDGLRALISYSCCTVRLHHGYKTHWRNAFRGGLIIYLGGVREMTWDPNTASDMVAFADRLLGSNSMWYAWRTTFLREDYNPELGVISTSSTSSCSSRMYVRLSQLTSTPRVQDDDLNYWCRTTAEI